MSNIKVLITCEESQTVCKAFRALGIEAYSNDLKYCSGGRADWHIMGDAFEAVKQHDFTLVIAHPPCTHLCVSGSKHFHKKIKDGRQQQGIDLFMKFAELNVPHLCIENPIGIMSSIYKQPTQIIQPWMFGDQNQKATCLWLKNLPPLFHVSETDLFATTVTHVDKGKFLVYPSGKRAPAWYANQKHQWRAAERAVTFPGIAKAMAEQWTDYLKHKYGEV